ncbi:MAG: hypothetical protein ACJAZ2_000747 [Glaciecola sp.]|jgi:hypothetical protein
MTISSFGKHKVFFLLNHIERIDVIIATDVIQTAKINKEL